MNNQERVDLIEKIKREIDDGYYSRVSFCFGGIVRFWCLGGER